MNPCPKPGKKIKPAIRTMKDGREICNLGLKLGMDTYLDRKRQMWERQGKTCYLCGNPLYWNDAVFEHQNGRGHGGGIRDDRIEVDGKPINGASHSKCNLDKASVRLCNFLDVP